MFLYVELSIIGSGVKPPPFLFSPTLFTENSQPHPFYNMWHTCSSASGTFSPIENRFCPSFFQQQPVGELHHYMYLLSLNLVHIFNIICYSPSPRCIKFCSHPFYRSILFSENVNPHHFTNFQTLRPAPFKKRGLPTMLSE